MSSERVSALTQLFYLMAVYSIGWPQVLRIVTEHLEETMSYKGVSL